MKDAILHGLIERLVELLEHLSGKRKAVRKTAGAAQAQVMNAKLSRRKMKEICELDPVAVKKFKAEMAEHRAKGEIRLSKPSKRISAAKRALDAELNRIAPKPARKPRAKASEPVPKAAAARYRRRVISSPEGP